MVAFPILMARRRDPLVPLDLFRSRTFTALNLATFFIYGALYVTFSYQGILLQNVLGYTALAAGAVGIPVGICLMLLSTRVGAIAGRLGARRFLVAGPLLMACALLWYARVPVDSDPWLASLAQPATLIPPVDLLVDILPSILLFGLGISCIVAPLTNTLMGSIPERHSGLASAINNAIARVGQPLLGAVVFLAISATFYSTLTALAPDLDGRAPQVRATFSPLNPPKDDPPAEQVEASRRASIEAFHQAMLVGTGLLVIGAGISAYGLRDEQPGRAADARGRSGPGGVTVRGERSMSRDWDARTYDRVADPMARWGSMVLDRLPLRGDERVLDAGCGSGRVTEQLADRLPHGRVVALDGSASMVEAARGRLARFGDRIEYVVADLGAPLPIAGDVDAVLSTATFHWVPDHDALFANLAAVTAPGGWLVAQCGGVGNIASIQRVLAGIGDGWLGAVHFETPGRDGAAPRGGRLRGHRVLADRGADPLRTRRAIRDVPADRRPGCAPRTTAAGGA